MDRYHENFTPLAGNQFLYCWTKNGYQFYRVLAYSDGIFGYFFLRLQKVKSQEIERKNGKKRLFPTIEQEEDGFKDELFYHTIKGVLTKKYPSWLPEEQRYRIFRDHTILTKEKEKKIFEKLDNLYYL